MSRRREWKCGGKRRFRDQAEALQSVRHFSGPKPKRHQGRDGKVPIRAYPCESCNGWHLTSKPARS